MKLAKKLAVATAIGFASLSAQANIPLNEEMRVLYACSGIFDANDASSKINGQASKAKVREYIHSKYPGLDRDQRDTLLVISGKARFAAINTDSVPQATRECQTILLNNDLIRLVVRR